MQDSKKLVDADVSLVRREGFKAFVEVAWDQIEPCPLIWEPHLDLLCAHYEAVLNKELSDLVVNVPPGTSKSTISSILFPVYAWITKPETKFLMTSYSESLSVDFARRSLNLMTSEWFKARWPHVQIEDETRANLKLYVNTIGGKRVSTMMGGEATGKHADILIADDPHKPEDLEGDADSVKEAVNKAWRRWVNTFSTRRVDAETFRRIVVMQRLHEEDIAGRMLKEATTVHLCLPMLYEPERHCKTKWGEDWRTEEGELLCPRRFPATVMAKEKERMTPRAFASQHQQRPAPAEGGLLKREYFGNLWPILPPSLRMYMSVDCNLKERKDTDRAIIQVWGVKGAYYYCIDQVGGRWSYGTIVQNVKMMKQKWPMVTNILIEDKANGTAVIDTLKGVIPGIIAIDPQGGKESRAESIEWVLRANNVLFPAHQAPWVLELVEEAASFPVGAHDDMVDAMTQFLVWILKKGKGRARYAQAMANGRAGHTFR